AVEPRDEVVVSAHVVDGDLPHARHDVHTRHHVGAVRDHHAGTAALRASGAHEIGNHPHATRAHAALEIRAGLRLGLGGLHPVVGGASAVLLARADEGELLGACNVLGMAPMQVATGIGLLVQLEEGAVTQHVLHEPVVLLLGPVGPDHLARRGQGAGTLHPLLDDSGLAHDGTPSLYGKTG